MLYAIVGIIIIILDQAVKLLVTSNITYGAESVKELIPGVISLVSVRNDGAAFSFLAGGGARIWFIVLTGVFTLLVILALVTNFISGKFGRWCMILVVAGGLSNCIDRVLYGYVLDMFKVELFDFAVFNVADIFITVGCIAFILYILFGGEKEPEPDADEYDEYDEEEDDRPKRRPLKESLQQEKKPVKQRPDRAARYAAAPAPRQKTRPAPVIENRPAPETRRPVIQRDNSDPFAEWDKFAKQTERPAGPAKQPQPAVERPVYTKPAPAPEPKPAPKKEESYNFDEMDLDAILNEFK